MKVRQGDQDAGAGVVLALRCFIDHLFRLRTSAESTLTSTVTIRVERKGETVAEVVARAPRYRAEISLRPGKYRLISSRNIAHNVAVMSGKLSEVTLTIPCI
jgi:hypothetical protein